MTKLVLPVGQQIETACEKCDGDGSIEGFDSDGMEHGRLCEVCGGSGSVLVSWLVVGASALLVPCPMPDELEANSEALEDGRCGICLGSGFVPVAAGTTLTDIEVWREHGNAEWVNVGTDDAHSAHYTRTAPLGVVAGVVRAVEARDGSVAVIATQLRRTT